MKVDISSIREAHGDSVIFQGEPIIDLSGVELDVELNQPVLVKGSVTNIGDGFLVQGEVSYKYLTYCNRCLESVSGSGNAEITEQFPLYPSTEDDESFYRFQGDLLDLSECLRQQVLLSLPMKYICKDDCRGLCPQCGQNLNQQECNCKNDYLNPQFDKLKSLLNPEGGGPDGKPQK